MENKKFLPLLILTLVLLTSCHEKSYRITGSIDLPEQISLADTIIDRPDLEGTYAYLIDLDGEAFDSTLVQSDHFLFEGKVDKREPYFAYLATDLGIGMVIIEPGVIEAVFADEFTASGTPLNNAITDIDAAMLNLQQDTYAQLAQVSEQMSDDLTDSLLMPYYDAYMQQYSQLLDSFYSANEGTLAGIYTVNVLTTGARTSAELEAALSQYPDYVSQSDLMQRRLDYMRHVEDSFQFQYQNQEEDLPLFAPTDSDAD